MLSEALQKLADLLQKQPTLSVHEDARTCETVRTFGDKIETVPWPMHPIRSLTSLESVVTYCDGLEKPLLAVSNGVIHIENHFRHDPHVTPMLTAALALSPLYELLQRNHNNQGQSFDLQQLREHFQLWEQVIHDAETYQAMLRSVTFETRREESAAQSRTKANYGGVVVDEVKAAEGDLETVTHIVYNAPMFCDRALSMPFTLEAHFMPRPKQNTFDIIVSKHAWGELLQALDEYVCDTLRQMVGEGPTIVQGVSWQDAKGGLLQ